MGALRASRFVAKGGEGAGASLINSASRAIDLWLAVGPPGAAYLGAQDLRNTMPKRCRVSPQQRLPLLLNKGIRRQQQ